MVEIKHVSNTRNVLSVVLYGCSGLLIVFGILLFLLLLSASSHVTGYDIFSQLADAAQLGHVVLRPFQAAFIKVGIGLFVVMLVIAALFFAAARISAHQAALSQRVRVLEDQLAIMRART